MRMFELMPTNGRQSFGHKAIVVINDDNEPTLFSYETPVCKIKNKKLIKLWNGYSLTTMTHIKDFIKLYDLLPAEKITAKWWKELEVTE